MTTDIAETTTWMTSRGVEVQATTDMLKRMFNAPTATDMEVYQFIQICRAQGLNPFLREAYLIKYTADKPASFVTGKETFTQRAEAHQDYDGMEAGIIVQRGDKVEHLAGAFKLKDDVLVGGWAKVHRKGWTTPVEATVALDEYDTNQSLWKSKPATMIRKVALVQALREAFPSSFAGLYDSSEMGQDLPEVPVVVSASPAETSPAADQKALPAKSASAERNGAAHFENMGGFMAWAHDQHGKTSGDVMGLAAELYPNIEITKPADVAPYVNDKRLIDAVKGAGS